MAKIYYYLVKAEKMTIDKVPSRWKETARELLNGGN